MKRFKIPSGVVCVLALVLSAGLALAGNLADKKVVVICGVGEKDAGPAGYLMVSEGINEGFKAAGISPVYQWNALSSLPSDEAKSAAGDAALAKAREIKPDLIITLGADPLKFVATKVDDVPVVFAWVFGSPGSLGMPKENVTGIIRASYAADIWSLAKKVLPKADTVGLISKYSVSMAGTKRILQGQAPLLAKKSGVQFKDMFLVNTFEEWADAVKNFPYDFIYLADTSRITKDGKELTKAQITTWTLENAKVPVIAATEADVETGALFSIVTSEKGIGQMAAETGLEILNGAKPNQVYRQSKKGKLVVNIKTAQKDKIEIPYDILSTAETVYE